jgi:hypothetical protein
MTTRHIDLAKEIYRAGLAVTMQLAGGMPDEYSLSRIARWSWDAADAFYDAEQPPKPDEP